MRGPVAALLLSGSPGAITPGKRPKPQRQPPLPPFDPNDEYGEVHTTLPPEQVIPVYGQHPATYLVGDFCGTNIRGEYEPYCGTYGSWTDAAVRNGGVRMTSGPWKGLWIPFIAGANSTPPTMLMTPMLVIYELLGYTDVVHAFLSEQCWRGYSDFCTAPSGWNLSENGITLTPDRMVAWMAKIRNEWGFRNVWWRGDGPTHELDDMFRAVEASGLMSLYIHGKEVDTWMIKETYEPSLYRMMDHIQGRYPIGVHFTADGDRGMGYPIGAYRYSYLNDWSVFPGVHLMQQLSGFAPTNNPALAGQLCPAGLQGSSMYYARRHINCGEGDAVIPVQPPNGANGKQPNGRVNAFEAMETAKLYGRCSEEYSALRNWQIICGTRHKPCAVPIEGSMGGIWRPNGDPLLIFE